MKERIKFLRKELKMNQTEFGQKLGIKQTTVAGYETGAKNPMDSVILSICREFNVNEAWLRTGEGEMFVALPEEDEVADMVYDLLGDNKNSFHELIIEIMRTYKELSPGSQEVINEYVSKLLANMAQKKGD